MSGDTKMNPERKTSSCNKFSICHWNLNRISAHNFIKLSLLLAYISVHSFDILCLLETHLDSTISSNDSNLIIPGYNVKKGQNSFPNWITPTHTFIWKAIHLIFSMEGFVFITKILLCSAYKNASASK